MANGDDADAEFVGNLLVAHSLANQFDHFSFTVGQPCYLHLLLSIRQTHHTPPPRAARPAVITPLSPMLSPRLSNGCLRALLSKLFDELLHLSAFDPSPSRQYFPNGVHQNLWAFQFAHYSH